MAVVNRNISYLNKDFNDFRQGLINFSQTYFPTTYTDFSAASPGMMFIEQASYVGDVLSYYLDNQIQETYIQFARQDETIFSAAYMLGYKPKVTALANTMVELFQLVPSKLVGGVYSPDYNYALTIPENTPVTSTGTDSITFQTQNVVDFTVSSSSDPTTVSVAQVAGGNPTYYLLRKQVNVQSGLVNTAVFDFGSYQEFPTEEIIGNNISHILDVTDSDGNRWYEVDYLAQDAVYDSVKNTNVNDPNNSDNQGDVPYILQLKKTQRRFATRFLNGTTLQLQFGSGNASENDETIIPNPDNVGLGLPSEQTKLNTAYSPTNFIFTNTYGIAPTNTTLTVRYVTGGGVESNVAANTITTIETGDIQFLRNNLNSTTAQYVFDSIAVNNPNPASGGQDGDTIEEIRQNTISNFSTQLRAVTAQDYLVRALSLPSRYGNLAKVHVQKPTVDQSNHTLELYTLSFDADRKLRQSSTALKQNLKTYLNEYRMVGDTLNIKDAYVINIGVDFEIITLPNQNNNEVLRRCIEALQSYFNIDNWQINEPIILRQINVLLDQIAGVQTVKRVTISPKVGTTSGYSFYGYDIQGATQNGVIYPSIDPMIFEVKYPNQDICGRVVTF